ncbi:MAG: C45 family autoproteolytic acyltransferase/hydrolase [Coprobacillaceae bacterium]
MEKVTINYTELTGTNYEIGYQLGIKISQIPALLKTQINSTDPFTKQQVLDMISTFDTWCPGLNDELQGYSDALNIPKEELIYCYMTYLVPNCSQLAILPSLSNDEHTYLARNVDFSHQFDDFTLCKTNVIGKYSHIGSSIVQLGRSDGINEYGLAISQTSCGLPVGKGVPGLQEPKIVGLQYWAVIRSLLENCKNVDEALETLKQMPIAYNLNLLLADSLDTVILFECIDGNKAYQRIDKDTAKQYLHSTNHPVLPELDIPFAMRNSIIRYQTIDNYIKENTLLSKEDLQTLLLNKYPDGLCCHWYPQFFGTTKSIVFDVTKKEVSICWGGLQENTWRTFNFETNFIDKQEIININIDIPIGNAFEVIKK